LDDDYFVFDANPFDAYALVVVVAVSRLNVSCQQNIFTFNKINYIKTKTFIVTNNKH